MSGYVVCRSCGTRIKAGREFCLKCFEPLPQPDEPEKVPLTVSLGLSQQTQMLIGVAALAIVGGLFYVIFSSETPAANDALVNPRHDVVAASPAPAAAGGTAPASAAASPAARGSAPPMPPIPTAVARDAEAAPDPGVQQQREQYETQLARVPKDAATHNKLALLLAQQGENGEAVKEFERAIAVASREPVYRLNLANLALAMGEWGRAVDQYRETVLLAPREFAPHYGLALALQRKGDHQLAVAEFGKARYIRADDPLVAMGMGASLEALGRRAESLQEYKDFLRLQPQSAEATRVNIYLSGLR